MHVVLGATGHVGAVVVRTLLERGERVLAAVHHKATAGDLRQAAAEIAAVDFGDAGALRETLRRGRRASLLNPPAGMAG